jgi:hypothetical protein
MKQLIFVLSFVLFLLAPPSFAQNVGYVNQASITRVASSGTSVSVLAARGERKGLTLVNDSNASAYVAFAATASSSVFTLKMAPGSTWVMPSPVYTGQVSAIWTAADGGLEATETY